MSSDEDAGPAASSFSNEPVDAGSLPNLHAADFAPLDPAYVRLRTVGAAIAVGIAAVIAGTAAVASRSWGVTVAAVIAVLVVAAIGGLQRLEVGFMGYLVREHDVSFRRGLISRTVATVPFGRVQHVSIARGPLDRRFGLATLQLRTAGGHVAITGLAHDQAERLKLLVSDRAAEIADEEFDGDAG